MSDEISSSTALCSSEKKSGSESYRLSEPITSPSVRSGVDPLPVITDEADPCHPEGSTLDSGPAYVLEQLIAVLRPDHGEIRRAEQGIQPVDPSQAVLYALSSREIHRNSPRRDSLSLP